MSEFTKYTPKDGRRPRQAQPHVEPARTTEIRRGPRDRAEAPVGWDKDIWHLARLFEQRAQEAKIELAKGVPVIYSEIDDLVTRYGIRGKSYRHEVHGCKRRDMPYYLAARCWYHYPPFQIGGHEECVINWVQMVEIIIAEFWSRIWDEYALDYFRRYFAEYGQAALKHWANLRVSKDIDARPYAKPAPMRRRASAATMQDVSKEG